jgi:cytochrome c oxidase subunit II
MASSPRTGRSSAAIGALVVGALLVLGVILVFVLKVDVTGALQRVVSSLYPPPAVTDRAVHIRDLYNTVFAIAIVIFFVVEGLIIWTVLRYRRKPGDDELPAQTHGNAVAEVVWTIVPTLIVAFMFVISWQTLNSVEAVSAEPQTRVRAVAGQFQWQFDYLAANATPKTCADAKPEYTQFAPTGDGGGLYLPAGRTVHLYLCSPDVIHAFYVPQFLFKRDVVPGRMNNFEFTIDQADAGQTFRGQCAELCGAGHRVMLFDVHALSGADFDAWLQKQVAAASASPPPPPSGAPAPSGEPAPSGGPAPSGAPAPGGATLQISAFNVAFEQTALQAPAGTPFKIEFDNKDQGTPHNVAIHEGSPTGAEVFKGEIFPGPAKKTYDVPALKAGAYAFVCTVHPNMTGTLTVQ